MRRAAGTAMNPAPGNDRGEHFRESWRVSSHPVVRCGPVRLGGPAAHYSVCRTSLSRSGTRALPALIKWSIGTASGLLSTSSISVHEVG